MIAWLELFRTTEDTMITVVCMSVFALLVFLSLTGPADRFR
jgi:hypothetical protein